MVQTNFAFLVHTKTTDAFMLVLRQRSSECIDPCVLFICTPSLPIFYPLLFTGKFIVTLYILKYLEKSLHTNTFVASNQTFCVYDLNFRSITIFVSRQLQCSNALVELAAIVKHDFARNKKVAVVEIYQ